MTIFVVAMTLVSEARSNAVASVTGWGARAGPDGGPEAKVNVPKASCHSDRALDPQSTVAPGNTRCSTAPRTTCLAGSTTITRSLRLGLRLSDVQQFLEAVLGILADGVAHEV